MQTKLMVSNPNMLISPAEVRIFLSLDASVTDSDLNNHIEAGTDLFEKMTGHILLKQRYKTTVSLENYAFCDLPYTPIVQIISCTSNGISVPNTDYNVIGGRFVLQDSHRSNHVEIIYEAGYETSSEIPASMKNSLMQIVADFYFYKGSEQESFIKNSNLSLYRERLF